MNYKVERMFNIQRSMFKLKGKTDVLEREVFKFTKSGLINKNAVRLSLSKPFSRKTNAATLR